jgi:hypothetical protein
VEIDKDKKYAELEGSALLRKSYKSKITNNNIVWRKKQI